MSKERKRASGLEIKPFQTVQGIDCSLEAAWETVLIATRSADFTIDSGIYVHTQKQELTGLSFNGQKNLAA